MNKKDLLIKAYQLKNKGYSKLKAKSILLKWEAPSDRELYGPNHDVPEVYDYYWLNDNIVAVLEEDDNYRDYKNLVHAFGKFTNFYILSYGWNVSSNYKVNSIEEEAFDRLNYYRKKYPKLNNELNNFKEVDLTKCELACFVDGNESVSIVFISPKPISANFDVDYRETREGKDPSFNLEISHGKPEWEIDNYLDYADFITGAFFNKKYFESSDLTQHAREFAESKQSEYEEHYHDRY